MGPYGKLFTKPDLAQGDLCWQAREPRLSFVSVAALSLPATLVQLPLKNAE